MDLSEWGHALTSDKLHLLDKPSVLLKRIGGVGVQKVQRLAGLPLESVGRLTGFVILGILMAQIRVMGVLSPFSAALCAALFQSGSAGLFAALGSALGLLLSGNGITPTTAFSVVGLSVATLCTGLSGYKMKKKLHNALFFALLVAGMLSSLKSPYAFLIATLDSILIVILRQGFLIAFEGFARIADKRPLMGAQTICLAALICCAVMGTAGIAVMKLNLMHILLAGMCMILSLCLPATICGCFGIAVGCMAALCGGASIQIVSNIGLCALMSGIAGRLGKFGSTLGFLLTNALFTYYFQATALSLHLGEAMIAALLCVLVPQRIIDQLSALVSHHVEGGEHARAKMVSLDISERIRAVASAFEKTSHVMAIQNEDKPNVRMVQRQLDFAAQELHKTARVVEKAETFDASMEREVAHHLMLGGLEPLGVAVKKTRDALQVRVDIQGCGGRGLCQSKIRRAVSDACGAPMSLQQPACHSPKKRKCTLKYAKVQPVIIRGGVASAKRKDSRVCGDVVSSSKLSCGRELFCLCDGMGSGETAREAAIMAVDLIQSYFEAGYSQDQVLITVNQLLTLRQSEVFAAADLLLIDTEQMQAKFIKTCAGPSFLVRDGAVSVIEMGALPMGVLDNMQPAVMEYRIKPNDCIVMASDGVSDAMQGEDVGKWLSQALLEQDESRAANALIEMAQQKMGNMYDDMTAIVLRVVHKR